MRTYITAEQAVSILPDGEHIHTFINGGLGLCGADWSRADIIDKLNKSDKIELTGEMAKSMKHGIAAYNDTAKYQSELLFIETDMGKLAVLEAGLPIANSPAEGMPLPKPPKEDSNAAG